MKRRDLVHAMSMAMLYAIVRPVQGQDVQHDHAVHFKRQTLFDAASKCSKFAELCIGHCIESLGNGDKSLAGCAASAREVLVVCNGLRALAAQDSAHLASYAKVAGEICLSCEKECRKHAQHEACRSCADACAACAAECSHLG